MRKTREMIDPQGVENEGSVIFALVMVHGSFVTSVSKNGPLSYIEPIIIIRILGTRCVDTVNHHRSVNTSHQPIDRISSSRT